MIEGEIIRLDRSGQGVLRGADGAMLRAPLTLPGERITGLPEGARIARPRILIPSPERVRAPCPHYASCGGCALMHGRDDLVAGWKHDLVVSALAAQGIEAQIGARHVSPLQSRRRVVLSGRRARKSVLLGFHARASDVIVDLRECLVAHPAINAALPVLREMVGLGATRSGEVKLTVTHGPAGLDVAARGGRAADAALIDAFTGLMARAGIARLAWGDEVLTLAAPYQQFGPARVTPPPGAFLQATPQGEAAILAAISPIVAGARRIIDLFAGCGTLSLPLAAQAEIHAVEGLSAPLEALAAGWRQASGLKRVTTERRDLAANPLQADELSGFDAAVIDPPRSGAPAQAQALAQSGLTRVAWVSCDPVTFARDARTMIAAGWQIGPLSLIDQFRYSPHVETVATFTR